MGKINHDPSFMVYIELNHAPIPHPGLGIYNFSVLFHCYSSVLLRVTIYINKLHPQLIDQMNQF